MVARVPGDCRGPECSRFAQSASGLCNSHRRQEVRGEALTPLKPHWNTKFEVRLALPSSVEVPRAEVRELVSFIAETVARDLGLPEVQVTVVDPDEPGPEQVWTAQATTSTSQKRRRADR